jgi:hypothetical protein
MSSVARRFGAALALSLAASAPAFAETGIGLGGQAQLVCSAGMAGGASAASGAAVDLGQLTEFCNDPDGFDVWIDYPASLAGAVLVVDGRSLPLTSAGTVRVSHATQAAQASVTLALDGAPSSGPTSLTVRMAPAKATALALASIAP